GPAVAAARRRVRQSRRALSAPAAVRRCGGAAAARSQPRSYEDRLREESRACTGRARHAMSALFEARGITKRFGGLTAVKDVEFSLESGIAAIIGPNGAGKTTLFNVFTGLYVPDAGEVRLADRSLVGLRADQITALGVCRTF